MVRLILFSCLVCLCQASVARGQQAAAAPAAAGTAPGQPCTVQLRNLSNTKQWTFEQVAPDHTRLTGQVDLDLCGGVKFFADQVDLYPDMNTLVASGNVVFTNPEGRIAADSVEFDTMAGTGTFHHAFGLMSLGAKADRRQFGNQEPDVYFYGEVIDKLGTERYRVTRGGFTTCVQPTPRWEIVSGSVLLNLNDYAIARNTVLKVKGVPLMYLPVVYYPIQDDDRATGFLLPTYGASTYRGQAISNAFFWVLGRSQDATFFHDWFTKAGMGEGAEYRYVAAPQSTGNFRFYRFGRKETQVVNGNTIQILPATTSYSVIGTAVHAVSQRLRARARVDYFTDVASQQLLQQNLYQATQRNRIIEGSLTAGLGRISTTALYQRNEVFNSSTSTVAYGSTPRLSASVAPQRLFDSPIYASMNAEYGFLPYEETSGEKTVNKGFGRIDAAPTIRVPLSKLTFLSVNTSAGFRTTYYTRSFLESGQQTFVDEPYFRRYASVRTDVVGPVFTKIWDTPESSFAERFKHVIEPAFSIDTTSSIPEYLRTPFNSDISDRIVGSSMRLSYGLTNRVLYRGRPVEGRRGQTREFITVGVQQTYYSNPLSSQSDTSYQSTQSTGSRDLSPVAVTARVSPSMRFDANGRVEYDVSGNGLQVVSVGSSVNGMTTSANVNFSRRQYSKSQDADDTMTASVRSQLLQRRTTGSYSISWDLGRGYIQSQSLMLTYMAQCCGLQLEFQKYNFQSSSLPIGSDRRFNFGFVLAGLGTFSNFFGAFGGTR